MSTNITRFVDVRPWECTDDEYFNGPCIGSSGIKRALGYDGPSGKSDDFGNAGHIAVLQPDVFHERVATPPPDCVRGSGPGQQSRLKAWEEEHGKGKIVLNAKEFEAAKAIRDSLVGRDTLRKHLSRKKIVFEKSLRAVDERTGLEVRIRPDAFSPKKIDDLKTAKSAAIGAFQQSIKSYGYFIQAALYRAVLAPLLGQVPDFWWIVVGKTPPYRVGIYLCTDEWLDLGDRAVRAGLDIIAAARAEGRPALAWWEAGPLPVDPPPSYLHDDVAMHEVHASRMRGAA